MNTAAHANPSRNALPACLAGRRCLDGYASTTLGARRDIAIETAFETHSETHTLYKKKSGFLSSGLDALNKTKEAVSAKGSVISAGRDLTLVAGIEALPGDSAAQQSRPQEVQSPLPGNLTVQGSALDAGRDLAIQTTGDLQLLAAYSQSRETTQRTTQGRKKLEALNFELEQNRALLATLTAGNSIDLNVGGNIAAQVGSIDAEGNLQADRMTATGVIKGSDRQQVSLTHTDDKKGTTTNGPTSKVLGNLAAQGIRSGASDSFAPEVLQTGEAAVAALMQNGLLTIRNQPALQAALNAPTANGSALTYKDSSGRVTLTVAGEAKV
ncbi:MAG: hemagglutinin repeat-containing protein, partial [Rhodocyclaceae bacterium]